MTKLPFDSVNKSPKQQTTVELTEELIPQAVLDEQEADRKERTYAVKDVEKEERLETLESRNDDHYDVF